MNTNKAGMNIGYNISYSGNRNKRVYLRCESDTVELSRKKENNNSQKISFKGLFTKIKNKIQKPQKTYNSGIYEGFEEHFFTLPEKLVTTITLTDKQKQILTDKIKAFEEYKASLDEKQKIELEKNKHSLLDFSVIDGYPDEQLKGYNKFLERYESFRNSNFDGITNEELSQLLYYTDTSDLISDGKIGSFAQGRTGDCWFLSMLNNYASTPEGENNLASRISKPDQDGNYTVTFDDPFNKEKKIKFSVTPEELNNYDLSDIDTSFSAGDLDVRIFEVAAEKLIKKYLLSSQPYELGQSEIFDDILDITMHDRLKSEIACGYPEKRLLIHKALGYESDIQVYTTIAGTFISDSVTDPEQLAYVEKTKSQTNVYRINFSLGYENGEVTLKSEIEATDYKNLYDVVSSSNMNVSEMTCSSIVDEISDDKSEERYLSTGHEYNLMATNSKEGILTVNDPYNSAFPHTINSEKFNERFTTVTYFPSK